MILKIAAAFFIIQIISAQILYFKFIPENVSLLIMVVVMLLFTIGICQKFFEKIKLTWEDIIGFNKFKGSIIKSVSWGIIGWILSIISVKLIILLAPNEWALKIINKLLKPPSSDFLIILGNIGDNYFLGNFFLFILMLGVVISEEIIFRGLMFKYIEKEGNFIMALIITSLIFGILHIAPYKVLFAFFLSIIYGLTLGITKNLISPIMAHCFYNVSLFYFGDYLSKIVLK